MIRVRLGREARGMGVIAWKGGQRFMAGAVGEVARGWSPGMSVMSQTDTLLLLQK